MNDLAPSPSDSLADPAHQLWQLWHQGRPPEMPEFLAAHPDLPQTCRVAVLRVDQQERWLRGERVRAEDYLRCCPALPEEYALDLVYSEFLLRERLGESPSLAEYAERFPQFAQRLRLQVEMFRALEASHPRPSVAPDGAAPNDRATTPQVGDGPAATAAPHVPGYEILGLLGRGGMGVVYRARHLRLRRLVALKMLRGDGVTGAELLARFRTESAALARLQHPNIVQVYEADEHQGRPYLALEYVEGGGLDAHAGGTPQPAARVVRLLEALARAVHYAHERGIVHRDLKPHNVLLTPGGDPKVTDFGLAKLLAPEAGLSSLRYETQAGAILGTPCYMAPEQTGAGAGRAGPAADVYALGAILYELLTGRPPLRGASPLETLEQVRRQEPVPPRRLQPSVPRDLDAVCLRCLEKEPGRRYTSAAELADDLARFAAGRPTRARPPGRLGRAARWGRRNPVVACLTAALALAVTAGFAVVTSFWWQAEDERAEAEHQRDLAAENVTLGRQAVDRFCTSVSEERLLHEPGMEGLRRELLQGAVEFYAKFTRQSGNSPALRLEHARASLRLGQLVANLGDKQEGIRLCEEGVKILEELRGDGPTAGAARAQLPRGYHGLAQLCADNGQHERAEALLRKALPLQEQLTRERPEEPARRRELAELRLSVGYAHLRWRRLTAAETVFGQARTLFEELARDDPSRAENRGDIALALFAAAELYAELGQPEKAEPLARESLAALDAVGREKPLVPRLRFNRAGAQCVLGKAHAALGRLREAVAAYTEAVEAITEAARSAPLRTNVRRVLALAHLGLGHARASAGEPREAEAAFRQAVDLLNALIKDDALGPEYKELLGQAYEKLGRLCLAEGRSEEGEAALARAVAVWQEAARGDSPDADARRSRGAAHWQLGRYYSMAGRTREADQALRAALGLARELTEASPDVAEARQALALSSYQLGVHYVRTGRPKEAEPFLLDAVALVERLGGSETPAFGLDRSAAVYWIMLGRARQLLGQREAAAEALGKGQGLCERPARAKLVSKEARLELAQLWCDLGQAQLGLGRLAEGRDALRRGLAGWEELASLFPRDLGVVEPLARLYVAFGELTPHLGEGEAATWYGRSLGALKDLREAWPNDPGVRDLLLQAYHRRVGVLWAQRRYAEMAEDCREAIELAGPERRGPFLVRRLVALTALSEYTRAAEEGQGLNDRTRLAPENLRVMILLYAAWSDMARRDTRLAAADRQARAEGWGAEGVRVLRAGQAAGRFAAAADLAWLETAKDIHPLRQRADFKALLAEVRQAREAAADKKKGM
jgi:serine/threonine-protein kinase